ncbi:MAG TPA: hypothetical protein VMJ10_30615 [Kofleriaceae bacterium]|nr:hypothetical protein [Kofleriaceae bacterium]
MRTLALASLGMLAGCVVGQIEEAPPENDPGNNDLGESDGITPDLAPISGCSEVTEVVLYSEGVYDLQLPNAFAANADPCTRYWVTLPALDSDKTQPRPGAANVHALGANFHAMAEFNWGAWSASLGQSPTASEWESAGQQFRSRMAAAGYDVSGGDTWAINEFPNATHSGDNGVWTNEAAAVKGLYEGDGTQSTRGTVYISGIGQTLADFSVYKPNAENWLRADAFWTAMMDHVQWFSLEVYADPHDDCVRGDSVSNDADHVSAYVEHLPRLAKQGGSQTASAARYLSHHYLPLLNAAWNSNVGFGDNLVDLDNFVRFSRLQVYAAHYWASSHGYPGRRIGFAWAPKNATQAQTDSLADVIAKSVTRAYPANKFYNYGKYACSTDGSLDGCGCQVDGASYNSGWDAFSSW